MLLVMFVQHFISSDVGVCLLGTLGQMFVVCSCNVCCSFVFCCFYVGRIVVCWMKFEDV